MAISDLYHDKFVPDVFNGLSDIDDEAERRVKFTDASTSILKKMMEKGVCHHVGLWYPHKHFDVSDGEYVASYVPQDKPADLVMQTSVLKDNKDFVPMCLYMHEGKWMPMQYVSKDIPGAKSSYDYFMRHAADFLPDIGKKMAELNLERSMGIVLRNDISLGKKDGFMLDEETNRGKRHQEFKWKKTNEYDKEVFITYWCVDDVTDSEDSDDKIKACFEVAGPDGIVKVGCQRAHQCCPPFHCS